MEHVVGHLVRRGLDAHDNYRTGKPDGNYEFKLSGWAIACLSITLISFLFVMGTIEYTYYRVIPVLAMVESPTAVLFEPLTNEDPDAPLDGKNPADVKVVEPELLLVQQAPITSSVCKTLKHLRIQGGILSRFRGGSVFVIYNIAFARLTILFTSFDMLPAYINAVLAAVILARLRMAWTHIVISEPSTKYWFQRLASIKSWKKVALPTAVFAACVQLATRVPVYLFRVFGLDKLNSAQAFSEMDDATRQLLGFKICAVGLMGIFMVVAVILPVTVSLSRVHASLLTDEDETIVPFDRSFGGKVVPTAMGGTGVISMLEAWKTFDWNSRVRLMKVYVTGITVETIATILFLLALFVQLQIFVGEDFEKMMDVIRGSQGSPAGTGADFEIVST